MKAGDLLVPGKGYVAGRVAADQRRRRPQGEDPLSGTGVPVEKIGRACGRPRAVASAQPGWPGAAVLDLPQQGEPRALREGMAGPSPGGLVTDPAGPQDHGRRLTRAAPRPERTLQVMLAPLSRFHRLTRTTVATAGLLIVFGGSLAASAAPASAARSIAQSSGYGCSDALVKISPPRINADWGRTEQAFWAVQVERWTSSGWSPAGLRRCRPPRHRLG